MRSAIYKDSQWWLALVLGVLFWIGLAIFAGPRQELAQAQFVRALLFGAVLYPILEEVLFRGAIQNWFLQKDAGFKAAYKGVTLANVLTSILFVVSHLFYHEFLWALLVFFPSLLFGYFRDRYRSLYPSILLHGYYNLGYLLFTTRLV